MESRTKSVAAAADDLPPEEVHETDMEYEEIPEQERYTPEVVDFDQDEEEPYAEERPRRPAPRPPGRGGGYQRRGRSSYYGRGRSYGGGGGRYAGRGRSQGRGKSNLIRVAPMFDNRNYIGGKTYDDIEGPNGLFIPAGTRFLLFMSDRGKADYSLTIVGDEQ